ncbi:hypothetical protein D3C87_1500780 [compost metagenome]
MPADLHADVRAHGRQALAAIAHRFPREKLEYLPGAHDLAQPFGLRLASFARNQGAQFFLARQDLVGGAEQDVAAQLRGAAFPGGRGGAGGLHRLPHLRLAGAGVLADHVLRVRGIQVRQGGVAIHPCSIDEIRFLRHCPLLVMNR